MPLQGGAFGRLSKYRMLRVDKHRSAVNGALRLKGATFRPSGRFNVRIAEGVGTFLRVLTCVS
jgi:hypothetical protein